MNLSHRSRFETLMIKRHVGLMFVWAAALLPLVLWLFTEPAGLAARRFPFHQAFTAVGQLAGLAGMAMLSIAFVLASRARFLEDYFGGLDKMYQLHHRLGVTAFVLLLIHPLAHALRFVPQQFGKTLVFLLPTHERLTVNLGVYAFWLLVLLMTLTLFIQISYDKWKLSHKVLGLVLILGAIHLFTVESTPGRAVAVSENSMLRYYMLVLAMLGSISFGYKLIVPPLLARRYLYTVKAVHRLNEEVLEIELIPRRRRVAFVPGQFVFVTFYGDSVPREAHPFTICSVPTQQAITLTVKMAGDFTTVLYQRLHSGASAKVEGPYGRFDYRTGSPRQVWLAGGVGIVPFLSWARHMLYTHDQSHQVTFYYCVHSRGDAVHYQEFVQLAAQLSNLEVKLVCSEERGHLRATDVGQVKDKDIFMCGPKRFTSDLERQFRKRGVPSERIAFEDFEFR